MRVATIAGYFGPPHTMTLIPRLSNRFIMHRVVETWPTRTRIEFCCGLEQRISTANAMVDTDFLTVCVFAGEGGFGSLVPGNAELLRC